MMFLQLTAVFAVVLLVYFVISKAIDKSGLCGLEDGSFMEETRAALRKLKQEKNK